MTGANLISFLSQQSDMGIDLMSAIKAKGTEQSKDQFASFLNQTESTTFTGTSNSKSVSTDESYDKYKYKDNSIETRNADPVREKMEDATKDIEEFEETVVKTISEELEVSEEDILKAMEALGFGVFDLLEPANLAQLTVELTDSVDPIQLLTDDSFMQLLTDVNQLGEELMEKLELTEGQFDELVQLMTVVEENEAVELPEIPKELVDELVAQETEAVEVSDTPKMTVINSVNENETDTKTETVDKEAEDKIQVELESEVEKGKSQRSDLEQNETGHQNLMSEQYTDNTTVAEANKMPEQAYVSQNTVEMINQIVESVKTSVASDVTTMELQLNPENLGKIYVNISSKEGSVNAQFTATNEIVKEALENQIVTLRENLSQAGVKVDALEVTVASHQFERNLEQGQSRQEQEGERQETMANKRRNIRIDSLEDLVGLMSEEESLVAQMMIDNGNSVDLTA